MGIEPVPSLHVCRGEGCEMNGAAGRLGVERDARRYQVIFQKGKRAKEGHCWRGPRRYWLEVGRVTHTWDNEVPGGPGMQCRLDYYLSYLHDSLQNSPPCPSYQPQLIILGTRGFRGTVNLHTSSVNRTTYPHT